MSLFVSRVPASALLFVSKMLDSADNGAIVKFGWQNGGFLLTEETCLDGGTVN